MPQPSYRPFLLHKIMSDTTNQDNWKHRSENMLCGTCMYFVAKETDKPNEKWLGRCRRHAPTMKGFPAVFKTDWCGDHKLDENKI